MVVARSIAKNELDKLHLDVLPRVTRLAFLECIKLPLFAKNNWYLAGGTALALQVGHRQSVDLDFFTTKLSFDELAVERELLATGKWQLTYKEKGTIYGVYADAKMSLIAYPFFIPTTAPRPWKWPSKWRFNIGSKKPGRKNRSSWLWRILITGTRSGPFQWGGSRFSTKNSARSCSRPILP